MWIRDNEAKENAVRKYGTDKHDSLIVSQDGKYLSYYNLQNGDGSIGGGYSFTDEHGNIPVDVEDAYDNTIYFNIGGFHFDELKKENEKLKNEFVAMALENEDEVRMAIYEHGYEKAVMEMINTMARCKAWMLKNEEQSVANAVDSFVQIVLNGLQGVKQPHRDTKTDEG